MKSAGIFLMFWGVAVLSACASQPTPYRPLQNGSGYSETEVRTNTWRIMAKGHSTAQPERLEKMALYRAAQLTLEQGYNKFMVIARYPVRRRDEVISVAPSLTRPSAVIGGSPNDFGGIRMSYVMPEPVVDRSMSGGLVIKLLKARRNGFNIVNAETVIKNYAGEFNH